MTDEPKWLLSKSRQRLRDGTLVENAIPLHLCSHPGCKSWGAYLIGAHWMRDQRGTAYCREHLPVNEALALGMHTAPVEQTTEADDANQPDGPGDLLAGPSLER